MKILLFSHSYPPVISGVSIVVQKVARAMVRRGHRVTVVTASDEGAEYDDVDDGVDLIRVRSAPNPFWSEGRLPLLSYAGLREIVARIQPDLIHTHDSGLLGVQLFRLEHEKGHVPELLTCHFLPQYVNYYVGAGDAIVEAVQEITWGYTMRIINAFDHVVFPTETQRQTFLAKGLESASSVISNGLDVTRYRPDGAGDTEVVARYDLPPGRRILAVGRLAKDKKLDVLIRSMLDVPAPHRAQLLLVGRGDDRARLEGLASSLGLDDRVRFLGYVPEADLPALYRQADIFAIASDVEVQSIPTLQAAATGLPIVAAAAGSLPELARPGANGILVPVGDPQAFARAFGSLLEDADLARRLGQASLDIGRQHDEVHTYDAYEALYRQYAGQAHG